MNGITALAKHIRDRDNPSPYTPMLGRIISLPELKIQLGSRILLYADDVQTTFDIYEKEYDSDGHFLRYKHMGKQAVMCVYNTEDLHTPQQRARGGLSSDWTKNKPSAHPSV